MSSPSVASVASVAHTDTPILDPAAQVGLASEWSEQASDYTEAARVGILMSTLVDR